MVVGLGRKDGVWETSDEPLFCGGREEHEIKFVIRVERLQVKAVALQLEVWENRGQKCQNANSLTKIGGPNSLLKQSADLALIFQQEMGSF